MFLALVSSLLAFKTPLAPTQAPTSRVLQTAAQLVLVAALTTNPQAAFAGDEVAGGNIFKDNCAACHVGGRNVIMPDKTLAREALQTYLDGGFNEAAVVKQVTNGKGAMPAFGNRLSDSDIANVATYVIASSTAGWPSQ